MKRWQNYETKIGGSIPVTDLKYKKDGKTLRRIADVVLVVSRAYGLGEPRLICQLRYPVEPVWGMSTHVWATVWCVRIENIEGLTADEILDRYRLDKHWLAKYSLCEIRDSDLRRIHSILKRGLTNWVKWHSEQDK